MGRWSTGALTTGQCLRLHIKSFSREIKKGNTVFVGSLSWDNEASISVALTASDNSYTVGLSYAKTDHNGEKQSIDYKIRLVTVPSNLGKGKVYHFLCPFSGKRCKVLYMGYGSLYFKSREAYNHRIYYSSQLSSHLDKHNDKYWNLERKLEILYKRHPKTHYRGKKTKPQKRIESLEQKHQFHDEMRWKILPKALLKSMGLHDVLLF